MKRLFFIVLFLVGLFHASSISYASGTTSPQFSKSITYTLFNKNELIALPEIWLADTESDDLQEQDNDECSDNTYVNSSYHAAHLTFYHLIKGLEFLSFNEISPSALFIFYSVFRL